MADKRSQASRPSWRGNGDSTSSTPARPKKSDYKWTERGAMPAGSVRRTGSRSFRLVAGLSAFAACLMLVVWLIWMINPPEPAALILVGDDYARNLAIPPNVLGSGGLQGIAQLSEAPRRWALLNPASLQLIRPRRTLDRADQWKEVIDDLKTGFHQKTLLIILGLHGGSDSSGGYLIPGAMKGPEGRLGLEQVIDSMKELADDKQKILVLDGAQVPADWRLGMLHNDFARRLKELEPRIRAVPNLWVLSGCDVDQRCWASEGLGRTVFTHYITEALRGGAAGSDRRLTLEELHRYVRDNVRRWAWKARGALQEPVLLPGRGDPAGGGSARPDRPDPKDVHLAMVEEAPPSQPPPPPDHDRLAQRWMDFRKLDAQVPHPAVTSPLRWRAYRAHLVRFQSLFRTGAADSAQGEEEPLRQLEQGLRRDQYLREMAASSEVNLVLNTLAGGPATPPPDRPEFLRFFQAPTDSTAEKLWNSLKTGPEDGLAPGRSLRSSLDEFLVRQAEDDPAKNFARAADRIRLSQGTEAPLPAESHLLRMLHAYLPPLKDRPPPFWRLISQALQARRLAERAALGISSRLESYPYSDQVHGWTRGIVEAADIRRREGEDRLFADDDRTWNQARDSFDAARAQYENALNQAGQIRSALAIRDRVLGTLPDYSRWLANRHLDDHQEELAGLVEDLWAKGHWLAERLERRREDVEPAAIDRAARAVDEPFQKLVARFEDLERSRTDKARLKEDWEEATAAAVIPFGDDDKLTIRSRIWERLDNIRKHDLEVAEQVATAASASASASAGLEEPDPDQPRRTTELARRRASLQGRLALAVLGENWFSDPAFTDQEQGDYAKVRELVRSLPLASKDADAWATEAARQGDRIGRRFRTLTTEIARLADEERGITDFAAFESRLARADRLARLVDPGAEAPVARVTEPTARYRQARARDFLVWMADRAGLDHWYDVKPQAKPYYQEIIARLLGDADKQFPELREAHQKLRERLLARGRLELDGPEQLVLTSELETPAAYRVVDSGVVPPGFPVVKPRPDSSLTLDDGPADYRLIPRGPDAGSIGFLLASALVRQSERRQADHDPKFTRPSVHPAEFIVEGFFRGQLFSRTTAVRIHPVPDTVAIGPAPPDPPLASVAVQANDQIIERFGQGTGTITIVLDCSGSMKYDGDGSKWENAKAALTQVLEQVPQGTTVSIWTFSQLPPGVLKEEIKPESPIYLEPERTISQLRPPAPWNPNQVNNLAQELKQLRPYLGTPLVEAMWRAAAKDLVNAKGMKTLLVLTDGMDNRFAHSKALNPTGKVLIGDFLVGRFRPLGIRVNLVYYKTAGDVAQLAEARKNFQEPLQRLDPPGGFFEAKDLAELIARLKGAINQRLVCQIAKADGMPVGIEPLEVSNPHEELRWWTSGLEPGTYRLRVQADKTYTGEVDLQNGDRLVVQLTDRPDNGIAFERALYGSDDAFPDAARQERGDWRLSVLTNQLWRRNQLDQLRLFAALESRSHAAPLRQLKPGLVGFQLGVDGLTDSAAVIALRWRERSGYPAPVWQLEVPQWPADPAGGGPARPILTTWWWDAAHALPAAAEFERDENGGSQRVHVDDNQTVQIEDIRLEDHLVEVQPGQPPQSRSCLVVRLAYPKDSPYFIDPEPLKKLHIPGYEHRFYSQAGKYAGLFWPVNADKFAGLRNFRVVSVNRLRNEAAKRKNTAEIKLARPRGEDRPPEPPQALLK